MEVERGPPPDPVPPEMPEYDEQYLQKRYDKSYLQRHRIQPGRAKYTIFNDIRDNLVSSGVYRPCNRFRDQSSVINKPLRLAEHVPMLPRYNFVRS